MKSSEGKWNQVKAGGMAERRQSSGLSGLSEGMPLTHCWRGEPVPYARECHQHHQYSARPRECLSVYLFFTLGSANFPIFRGEFRLRVHVKTITIYSPSFPPEKLFTTIKNHTNGWRNTPKLASVPDVYVGVWWGRGKVRRLKREKGQSDKVNTEKQGAIRSRQSRV